MFPRLVPLALTLAFATASAAYAQYVPPVLKGIKGDGTPRTTNGPIPFPAADERWLIARSRHFVFISSADETRTRQVAAELETLAAALTQVDSAFSAPSSTPTRVILFTKRRESRPYFDMLLNRRDAEVSGVFVSQRNGGSMLINEGYGWRGGDRAPLHELVHYLLQSGEVRTPLWLEEGIAEYFSNATIRRGSISAGEPMTNHIANLRQRARIPPRDLFTVVRESDTYNLPAGQAIFYAESWAIVDWLVRTSGHNGADFFAFVHDVSHGVPIEAALQTRYHRSLRDIDWALSRYATPQRSAWAISIPVPATATSVGIQPLDRAAILYELGHFLTGMEELSGEAERHFRAALDANPNHARSLAGLGSLRAAQAKYAEGNPLFERAIAADPDDVEIQIEAYNQIVVQVNAGKYREASKALAAFLTNATDPDILRDAKKLQEQLVHWKP